MEDGELDALKLSSNMKSHKIMNYINEGCFGKVYKSKWLELVCTIKKMNVKYHKLFIKEMNKFLASLRHPNLIKYFFCNKK